MINYAVSTDDNDKLSFFCVMRRPKHVFTSQKDIPTPVFKFRSKFLNCIYLLPNLYWTLTVTTVTTHLCKSN